ncbi:MAG: hypothetical protein IT317_04030 [Anaerolineales bacterium]|nr:hypothetical protein [Anaerolineales bacterium]
MPYIPPTSHVTLLATLRRERLLPLAGDVIAQARQRVEAADVVAHTFVADRHHLVDVGRKLGLPDDQADSALVKQDGDLVKQGEPIAVRKTALGLRKLTARSPADGRLVAAAGGKALVAAISKPFELRAGIPGQVVTILQSRGVVLETTGALLEGVWGNGREDSAPLRLLGDSPTSTLTAALVDMNLRGALLACGQLADPAVLKTVADVRPRGLIVGGLAPGLVAQVRRLDFPLLVVEGFGQRGFSAPAYALLKSNAWREAWLNAIVWDRFSGKRPELIVPLPSPSAPPPAPAQGEALAVGKRVRVLRGREAGKIGAVLELGETPVLIASGLRVRVARVMLEGGPAGGSAVPFANLELLE